MSETLAVSVIMPSLNVADYIETCVRSVMNQTLKNMEIICVDAGSTDGTAEILQTLAEEDSRIRLIRSDRKSYGYQMNLGIREARGEYIGIVETDDYVSPEMFQTLYTAASQSGAEVVKANHFRFTGAQKDAYADACTEVFAEGLSGLPYNRVISPADHQELFLTLPSIWNAIYNRRFLLENSLSFVESPGASYQDTGFIVKVWLCAERVYLLKEAFYHYRTDNENSSVNSSSKIYCVCDEFASVQEFLDRHADRKHKYGGIVCARKLAVYFWNYQRLRGQDRLDFLYRIRPELLRDRNDKLFNSPYMKPFLREMARQVIEAPELYYAGHRDMKDHIFATDGTGSADQGQTASFSALFTTAADSIPAISVILRVRDYGSRTGELLFRTADSLRTAQETAAKGDPAHKVILELLLYSDEPVDKMTRDMGQTDGEPVETRYHADLKACLQATHADYILVAESGDLFRRDLFNILWEYRDCDLTVFNGFLYEHRNETFRREHLISDAVLAAMPDRGQIDRDGERFDLCTGNKIFSRSLVGRVLQLWEDTMSGRPMHSDVFGFLGRALSGNAATLAESLVFKNEYARRSFLPVPVLAELWQCLHLQGDRNTFERQFYNCLADRAAETGSAQIDFCFRRKLSEELRDSDFAQNYLRNLDETEGYIEDEDSRAALIGLLHAAIPSHFADAEPHMRVISDQRAADTRPRVSVIVPVYNTEAYLGECIASLRNQTLRDIEIICVNDGSTDTSTEILRELAAEDGRMVILEQDNCGQSVARNVGVDAARGDYLYFIDSDDYLEVTALEKLCALCEANALDILFFEGDVFYEDENAREKSPMTRDNYRCRNDYQGVYTGTEMLIEKDRYGEYRVSPCMQIIRRQFYTEKGLHFYAGIYYEDNLFAFTELLAAQRVMHLREALYMRRIAADSTTSQGVRFEHPYGYFICFRQMMEMMENCSCPDETKAALYTVILRAQNNAIDQYKKCSPAERERYLSLPERDRYGFYTCVVRPAAGDIRNDANLKRFSGERAELNRKLQKTYDEKAERGIRIRQLEEQLAHTWGARAKRLAGKALRRVRKRQG